MELDAKPRLTEAEEVAVRRALATARVQLNGTPPAYTSPWRRAALAESRAALDESVGSGLALRDLAVRAGMRDPTRSETRSRRDQTGGSRPIYAPSPRSTRGATRA